MRSRTDELKETYHLEKHVEGGSFSEIYTAPFPHEGRSMAGSIYFLLDAGEISHFHQIDCDEIWYWHEGCGMKITMLLENEKKEFLLGGDIAAGQRACAVIPKGCIFAAENLQPDGYTFISCVTVPHFRYEGFRLADKKEIRQKYPDLYDGLEYLAY